MYEELTWKPLEMNSLADILTLQTGCTQPITVTPAYTPAVVTLGATTPSAAGASFAPNKALIQLSVAYTVTLNSDIKTRGHIKIIATTGGEILFDNTGADNVTYAPTLPLNIVTTDTNVSITLGVDALKPDGVTWYSSKTVTYTNITLVAYKPAVIDSVVPAVPLATMVKTCGNPVGFTYNIVALNHDINIQAAIDLIGEFGYNYPMTETTVGTKSIMSDLADAFVGVYTVYYTITNSKPGGNFTTLYLAMYTNRTVVDKTPPIHASCDTIPLAPITVGSGISVTVHVTEGNCYRSVKFQVYVKLTTDVNFPDTPCYTTDIYGIPGNLTAIPIDYPAVVAIPSSCFPSAVTYNFKISMVLA